MSRYTTRLLARLVDPDDLGVFVVGIVIGVVVFGGIVFVGGLL